MLFIGRKYSALHAVARNLANGVPLDAAMWNAHCIFGVSVRALYVIWPKFLASDGVFWTSSRGSHPKTQWLLEDVDVQIACRRYCDSHSDAKGAERLSPKSFAKWFNSELLPEIVTSGTGKGVGEYGVVSEARHRTPAPEPDASVPPSAPGQLEPVPERVVIPPTLLFPRPQLEGLFVFFIVF